MKLIFVGTRGEIETRSRRHYRPSALLVSFRGKKVLIDCGADWLGRFQWLRPDAIVQTHAHVDHAGGLRKGAPCPVFATSETWHALRYPIDQRRVVKRRRRLKICEMTFEAFSLEHSLLAPAVGWRVCAGSSCFFYARDVISIHESGDALDSVRIYIGDAASFFRPLLRKRGRHVIGHTSMRQQLRWCARDKVRRAIFTHCGSQIAAGEEKKLVTRLRRLADELGVKAQVAYDGMTVILR